MTIDTIEDWADAVHRELRRLASDTGCANGPVRDVLRPQAGASLCRPRRDSARCWPRRAGIRRSQAGRASALLLVVGVVATSIGGVSLAPVAITRLPAIARRSPNAVRLALRDLARYRARSAAALSAISFAVIIAAVVCIAATARYTNALDLTGPNLPANQLTGDHGSGLERPVSRLVRSQAHSTRARAHADENRRPVDA